MHNQSLTETEQNVIKKNFLCINMFDHQGLAVVRAMNDLTVGVFEHLEITSPMDFDQIIGYT